MLSKPVGSWRPGAEFVARARLMAVATLLLSRVATAATAEEPIAIAVLDVRDAGAGAPLAANVSDMITVALSKLGVFTVLSRADLLKMIELEATKQLLGCDEATCLAEIGGALGVRLLVSGSVGKVGEEIILSLTLTDTKTVQVLAREQRTVANVADLALEAEGATRFLVRDLLRGRQGDLIVTASESGADVEIDGRIVGVTPLGRQTLAGGPHTLKLNKQGFITWARDIDIDREQATVVDATLMPSAEVIVAYDRSAFAWRLAAYLTGGFAVAAVGVGVGAYLWNADRAQRYEVDLAAAGCRPTEAVAGQDCTAFATRRSDILGFQPVVYGALAGGAVLAGVSLFLFLQGPEVGAYDRYRAAAGLEGSVGFAPTAGGATAWGNLRF